MGRGLWGGVEGWERRGVTMERWEEVKGKEKGFGKLGMHGGKGGGRAFSSKLGVAS